MLQITAPWKGSKQSRGWPGCGVSGGDTRRGWGHTSKQEMGSRPEARPPRQRGLASAVGSRAAVRWWRGHCVPWPSQSRSEAPPAAVPMSWRDEFQEKRSSLQRSFDGFVVLPPLVESEEGQGITSVSPLLAMRFTHESATHTPSVDSSLRNFLRPVLGLRTGLG